MIEYGDDGWFDDCECGWSSGHCDVCTCASVAAELSAPELTQG